MKTVFIFGLGYVGVPLAQSLADQVWQVRGTTRTPSKLADKASQGWQILPFQSGQPLADPAAAFANIDAIISTITAIGGSDPVIDAHGGDLANFSGWSGYVSATSVYPDMPHDICYEDTEVAPATARGKARVIAEAHWQEAFGTEFSVPQESMASGEAPLMRFVMVQPASSNAKDRSLTAFMLMIFAELSLPPWPSRVRAGSLIWPIINQHPKAMLFGMPQA